MEKGGCDLPHNTSGLNMFSVTSSLMLSRGPSGKRLGSRNGLMNKLATRLVCLGKSYQRVV
jgi:hypothetical protein